MQRARRCLRCGAAPRWLSGGAGTPWRRRLMRGGSIRRVRLHPRPPEPPVPLMAGALSAVRMPCGASQLQGADFPACTRCPHASRPRRADWWNCCSSPACMLAWHPSNAEQPIQPDVSLHSIGGPRAWGRAPPRMRCGGGRRQGSQRQLRKLTAHTASHQQSPPHFHPPLAPPVCVWRALWRPGSAARSGAAVLLQLSRTPGLQRRTSEPPWQSAGSG